MFKVIRYENINNDFDVIRADTFQYSNIYNYTYTEIQVINGINTSVQINGKQIFLQFELTNITVIVDNSSQVNAFLGALIHFLNENGSMIFEVKNILAQIKSGE